MWRIFRRDTGCKHLQIISRRSSFLSKDKFVSLVWYLEDTRHFRYFPTGQPETVFELVIIILRFKKVLLIVIKYYFYCAFYGDSVKYHRCPRCKDSFALTLLLFWTHLLTSILEGTSLVLRILTRILVSKWFFMTLKVLVDPNFWRNRCIQSTHSDQMLCQKVSHLV
jgi:hypothetical protein